MTRNVQELEEFFASIPVDPEVEARRAMHAAITAWANIASISSERREFISQAIGHSSGQPDYINPKMEAALDALKGL